MTPTAHASHPHLARRYLVRRYLAAAVGGLALALSFGSAASAAPTEPPVTTADQQLTSFDETVSAVTPLPGATTTAVSPSSGSTAVISARAAAIHCWTLDVTRRGKNVFGKTLISLTTHTSWCGDGRWIRSRASTTSSHTTAFGWAYEGMVRNYNEYGINWNQFHSVREAQFCLLNCVAQSKYLTNDISVGPAGQVYHR